MLDLLRRFLLWRIGWRWYASLLIIPATYLLRRGLHALVNGIPLDFTATPAFAATGSVRAALALMLPVFVANVLGNGEEIGWRGYALPRLQSRYAALFSALVLGLIWAVWHIAVYIRSFNPIWFGWYVVGVIAKSVLITWAYNGSRGSLLLATLYHAMWNTAGIFLPITTRLSAADPGAYAYVVLSEVAVAAVITVLAGPEHLSRTRARQMQELLNAPSQPPPTAGSGFRCARRHIPHLGEVAPSAGGGWLRGGRGSGDRLAGRAGAFVTDENEARAGMSLRAPEP